MALKFFLEDILNNKRAMATLGNPTKELTNYIKLAETFPPEYAETQDHLKRWDELTIADREGDLLSVSSGVATLKGVGTFSSEYDNALVTIGTTLNPYHVADDTLWIPTGNGIFLFDKNLNYKGTFLQDGTEIEDLYDTFMLTVSDTIVYAVSYSRNKVTAYDKETREFKWVFGDTTKGDPVDGKLYSPTGVALAQNGNVLVSSYYGKADGSTISNGFIIELDAETGDLVKEHCGGDSTTNYSSGTVYRPTQIKTAYNSTNNTSYLFILNGYSKTIGVFTHDADTNTYTYNKEIVKPASLPYDTFSLMDFWISDDVNFIYIAVGVVERIICLSLVTGELISYLGKDMIENYPVEKHTLFGFSDIRTVCVFDNKLIVSDSTNRRHQYVPLSAIHQPTIEISYCGDSDLFLEASTIEFSSEENFDARSKILTVASRDVLNELPPTTVVVAGSIA